MFANKERFSIGCVSGGLVISLLTVFSLTTFAAEYKLFINKDQSASNVIVFEDNMSATVTHTAEGMELTLPGVEVALRCKSSDGNNTTDTCVIAIEPGSTASSSGSTSSGSTSGGSTSGGSTSGGSTSGGDCVVTTWNDCGGSSSGGSTSGGSTSGGSTSGGSTSGGSTSGGSTSGGSTGGGSGSCSNTGDVQCGSLNYGSAGSNATGNTSRITLKPGTTLALPFSVVAGSYYGKVGIVPTSTPFPSDGSQVRMWWSTEAGGKPLSSSECQRNLGSEGSLWWDQTGGLGFGCPIANQKGTYFVNLKLCISGRLDGSCSDAGARDGTQSATVYISGAVSG